jgi:hypothetical protein
MHFVVSALLLCSFVVLLLAGLASVLRDLLSRELRPMVAPPAGRGQRSQISVGLDLDLPRDLDHPLRR